MARVPTVRPIPAVPSAIGRALPKLLAPLRISARSASGSPTRPPAPDRVGGLLAGTHDSEHDGKGGTAQEDRKALSPLALEMVQMAKEKQVLDEEMVEVRTAVDAVRLSSGPVVQVRPHTTDQRCLCTWCAAACSHYRDCRRDGATAADFTI